MADKNSHDITRDRFHPFRSPSNSLTGELTVVELFRRGSSLRALKVMWKIMPVIVMERTTDERVDPKSFTRSLSFSTVPLPLVADSTRHKCLEHDEQCLTTRDVGSLFGDEALTLFESDETRVSCAAQRSSTTRPPHEMHDLQKRVWSCQGQALYCFRTSAVPA